MSSVLRIAAITTFAVGFGGCDATSVTPTDPQHIAPGQLAPSSATSSITIYDDNGIGYTFDPDAAVIRVSSGETITLSPERAASAANAFQTVALGDQLEADLANLPPDDCVPTEHTACPNSGDVSDDGFGGGVVLRYVGTDSKSHRGGRFGFRQRVHSGHGSRPGRASVDEVTTTSHFGYPCSDMRNAIMETIPVWREKRKFLSNTLAKIRDLLVSGIPGWETIPEAVAAYDQAAYELIRVEIGLWIMASQYSANGCWEREFPASWSSGGYGQSIGSGAYVVCVKEHWDISFDGGRTWSTHEVSVCSYQHVV